MDKLKNKKNMIIGLIALVVLLALTGGVAVAAGVRNTINAWINVPQEVLEEDLGTYLLPEYEVVDANGMILAGYRVSLVSVTGPDGEVLDGSLGSLMVETPGVYEFLYTARRKNVEDAVVRVDFGDRTAPSVKVTGMFPDFYITGNTYKIPAYTVEGDADRTKCWVKVLYLSEKGGEQEVEVRSNQFRVDQSAGSYVVRIHVEDSAGNYNDYEYARAVDGPQYFDQDTVLYFGEEFGARQVVLLEGDKYSGQFVSREEAPEYVYGEESGSYKLTFHGEATQANEGYVVMKTPAILDISNCLQMEMYVYNDSGADIVMGSRWWNDQSVKDGEWTRVTWPVNGWGGEAGNVGTDNIKTISAMDISGTVIRFIFDYSGETVPSGTFYLSPMKVVRRGESELVAGEHVILDRTSCYQGETVQLRAEEIQGKVVDCFLADDIPLAGDTFVPTEATHTITVRYADQLTYDNMTWGRYTYEPEWWGNAAWLDFNTCIAKGVGQGTDWALSFDVTGGYDPNADTNQLLNAAVMIGTEHIIEFQVNHYSDSVCKWYGEGAWEDVVAVLSGEVVERFAQASPENPANVLAIRRGGDLYLYVDEFFIGKTSIGDKPIRGEWFGYASRAEKKGAKAPSIRNLEGVSGEEKVGFVYEERKYYLDVESCEPMAVIDGDSYSAPAAQVKDVDGNVAEGAAARLSAVSDGGESFAVKGRNVSLPYGGAVNLKLSWWAYHPQKEGRLTASAQVTVQKSTGVIMEADPVAVSTIDANGNEVAFDNSVSHGTDKGAIRVTVKEGDTAVFLNMFDFTGYDYVDFWVLSQKENTLSGSYWLGDTVLKPGAWTRVRIKLADENVYLKDSTGNDFCPNSYHKGQPYVGRLPLRFMGEGSKEGTQYWVSSVQAGSFGPVQLTTKNCSADKDSYMQGDTIHLNPDCAPEGWILDYFSVNGELTDKLSFELLDREYVIEAFYRPKNVVFWPNDFNLQSLGAGNTRVEWDPNVRYGDDNGSVKLVLSGNDNGIFLRNFNFSGYDYVEFYVYTNTKKLQSGAWWCGDIPLKAENWTRVRIRLNAPNLFLRNPVLGDVWPNKDWKSREGELVVRFFGSGCKEGVPVWLSGVRAYRNDENADGSDPIMAVDANADEISLHYEAKSAEYTTQKVYDGSDKLVKESENGTLKVTVGGPEASVCVAGARTDDISRYEQVYFYVYTDARNTQSGGWWCGDTPLRPGQWTKVVLTKEMGPQNITGESIFESTPNNFAYRFMGGQDGDVFYVTSLYTGKAGMTEATVTGKNVTADKATYQKGETVTLTATLKPPAGLDILYVVNGKPLAGNTFVVEDAGKEYTVEALYRNPGTGAAPILGAEDEQVVFLDAAESSGYAKDKVYDGDDLLVRACETGSLKVSVTGPEAAVALSNALISDISGFDSVYFYVYTDASDVQAGGWWCGDTHLTPGAWTKVTLPKIMTARAVGPWNFRGESIFSAGPDGFVYRFMGGKEGDIFYVTSLYAQMEEPEAVADHMTLRGCTTDKDSYKRGELVTLTAVGTPAGLEAGGFTVNGQRIEGNTFTYLGYEMITVEAWYRNPVTEGVKALDVNAGELPAVPADTAEALFVTDRKYDGSDELVKASDAGLLKVTVKAADAGICVSNALFRDISGYDQVYFYVYTDAPDTTGISVGSWWCGDTALMPNQWTKVTMKKTDNLTDVSGVDKVFEKGLNSFVYRFVNAPAGTVFHVTSLYAEMTEPDPVEGHITLIGCTTDKDGYKNGETVTLTAAEAPAGLEFGGFIVNGQRIEGNSFLYESGKLHRAEACYRNPATEGVKVNDIHRAVLDDSCIAGAGVTAYAIDPARAYDGDDVLVRTLDQAGTLKLTANADEAAFAVPGAVMDDISGYDQVYYYAYTDDVGVKIGGWWCGDTSLTPGAWTKVVMPKVNTSGGTPPWNAGGVSVFEAGPDNFVYRLQSVNGGATIYVTSLYAEMIQPDPVKGHITLLGCTTDKDGYKNGETVKLTAGEVPDGLEAAGFIVNGARIDADSFVYESGKLYRVEVWYRNPVTGGVKVLDVNTDKITPQHDGGTAEYVTDKVYDGGDELVKASDTGLLKVTVNGGEAGFGVENAVVNDISAYDQVYFYVYTETAGVQSGGWWCGDTPLTAGQWTKVTLTKEMGPQNLTGASIFTAGPDNFAYRFMRGTSGTVFYVTSLYAEMIAPDPVEGNIALQGCTTDKDGYKNGETVTLTAEEVPAGLEAGFTVNGVRIDADSFVYESGKLYRVEVWYRNPVTGGVKVNDIHRAVLDDSCKVGDAKNGLTAYGIDSAKVYDGDDALVRTEDQAGTLKLTATTNEAAFAVPGGVMNDISGYDQVYYYAYTDNAGVKIGGWWCGDTELTPGVWTKIVMPKNNNGIGTPPWNAGNTSIFDAGPDNFVYRLMDVNGGATIYVTSLYAEMGGTNQSAFLLEDAEADESEGMDGAEPDGSDGSDNGGPDGSVSSGDAQMGGSVSSGDAQTGGSVSSGDVQTGGSVSSGDAQADGEAAALYKKVKPDPMKLKANRGTMLSAGNDSGRRAVLNRQGIVFVTQQKSLSCQRQR